MLEFIFTAILVVVLFRVVCMVIGVIGAILTGKG